MTRLHLLLTVACVTGAAASAAPSSPKSTSPKLAAAAVAPATTKADRQPNIAWLAQYGTYDARKGTWNFIPNGRDGC